MKKIISFFVILSVLLSGSISAKATDTGIIGHIYSTDILTFVNQKPIRGYNIGGRTVVIAEDFVGYGFLVEYSEPLRRLDIFSDFTVGDIVPDEIPRGKVGEILGNVYETDIKTYYNGIWIRGYNIGGRTAVCLEDLGDLTQSSNASYGFSDYLGKSVWDEENRIISYTSLIDNADSIMGTPGVSLTLNDNMISVALQTDSSYQQEGWSDSDGYSSGSGMSKYSLRPLYFDDHGEAVAIGCVVCHSYLEERNFLMWIDYPQKVMEMIQAYLLE